MIRALIFIVHIFTTGILFASFAIAGVVIYFNQSLPDHNQLAQYSPATVARVYAYDGTLIDEYAKEKRVFVPIEAIPKLVIHAFISAEDRNFYSHKGVDAVGIARAMVNNIYAALQGGSLQGGSTITQQVAKNMLLSRERTFTRKIKEAILAFRIEQTFSKERIMELYLNELYLGAGSYGVATAALNYFNKSIDELNTQEAALLAALPKAPSYYNPRKHYEKALTRRNWVIRSMAEEEYITKSLADFAITTPIGLKKRERIRKVATDYFTEEIRRQLLNKYGYDIMYKKGYAIHSTLNIDMQKLARKVFRKGLVSYDKRQGYSGPLGTILNSTNWHDELISFPKPKGSGDWLRAVVLSVNTNDVSIGIENGDEGSIDFSALKWAQKSPDNTWKRVSDVLVTGNIILVKKLEKSVNKYALRQIPEVNGGMVVIDPHTGRILAMVGGFDYSRSQFNRATQAKRQTGSAFKPFVYLSALEDGYTPANLIADEPITFDAEKEVTEEEKETIFDFLDNDMETDVTALFDNLPADMKDDSIGIIEEKKKTWSPQNYTGNFYGPTTLRKGVEKSLNVMTVHLGLLLGTEKIIKTAEKLGLPVARKNYLSSVLGTTETDLLTLTNAYAMLVAGGRKITPTLIEHIQDRNGRTIYRRDNRPCALCTMYNREEDISVAPEVSDNRPQAIDPRNAYQMVSILEGVVKRGTGKAALALGKPLAGKTGTTNSSIDAWFVGFSPDLVVGVYVGHDNPESMGDKAEGATIALPIFNDFMREALKDSPTIPFRIPPGIHLTKIDRKTGFLPSIDTPGGDIILEAFLPGTAPKQSYQKNRPLPVINASAAYPSNDNGDDGQGDMLIQGTGSIY